ncbi:uncharacterized protein LOC131157900 [Malania oleifera]|uniref:uncharacterized protein LOC131157900 n=1 Tax=Malania oleifera TaxID=397392 RepID=UPI0025AE3703|nr:uncharacterized protein LOC131157900 [Malania oleifera]
MEDERESSSLKHKLKSSLCLSCCFRSARRETLDSPSDERPRLIRASSSWLRSRAQDLPEIRDKCRNIMSRIGRSRRQSHDFRYDPLSYALNFDEGFEESYDDEFPLRNFSARLPAAKPPPGSAASPTVPREIAACS